MKNKNNNEYYAAVYSEIADEYDALTWCYQQERIKSKTPNTKTKGDTNFKIIKRS